MAVMPASQGGWDESVRERQGPHQERGPWNSLIPYRRATIISGQPLPANSMAVDIMLLIVGSVQEPQLTPGILCKMSLMQGLRDL